MDQLLTQIDHYKSEKFNYNIKNSEWECKMNFEKFSELIALNRNDVIKKYIKKFMNYSDNWFSPLILSNNTEVLNYAIDIGFNFNQELFIDTILLKGNVEVLEKMIEKGFVLNNDLLKKGLILACYGQSKEMIDFFLSKGSNINVDSTKNVEDTPLNSLLGQVNTNDDLFHYLLSLGATPTLENNFTLLQAIENSENLEIIQYLVENFNFNLQSEKLLEKAFVVGASPLIIKYLMDKNCPIKDVSEKLGNYLDSTEYFFEHEKESFNQILELFKEKKINIKKELEEVLIYLAENFVKNSQSYENKYIAVLEPLVKSGYLLDAKIVRYLNAIKNPSNLMSYAKDDILNNVLSEALENNWDIISFSKINFKMDGINFRDIFEKSSKDVITQFLISNKIHEENVLFKIMLNKNLNESEKIELFNQLIKISPSVQNIHYEHKDGNIAAYAKTVKLAEMFLNLDIKPLQINKNGFNSLYYDHMTPELIDFWVKKGLDVNLTYQTDKKSALYYHLSDNKVDVIKTFLKHKAKITTKELKEHLNEKNYHEIMEYKKMLKEKEKLEASLKDKTIKNSIKNKI
jgi:hypothetical protein